MVIHSEGGEITTTISPEKIEMILEDRGQGNTGYWKGYAGGIFHCFRKRAEYGVWRRYGASEHEKPHR